MSFEKGLNVILAERDTGSSEKDSRNGIGKSSILEIINFCLGSDLKKSKTLKKPQLDDWLFSLEMTIGSNQVIISRNTSNPDDIIIEGDTSSWPINPIFNKNSRTFSYSESKWKEVLGKLMFKIPTFSSDKDKYVPSFRSLISYFIRLGKDSYNTPFKYFPQQPAWIEQVSNCFLLGLSWEYAKDWQYLKDEEKQLSTIRSSLKDGIFSDLIGNLGDLETTRLQLENKVDFIKNDLKTFKVHSQYRNIEEECNTFTKEIHKLSNKNISSKKIIDSYQRSTLNEIPADYSAIYELYKNVGVIFPKHIVKKLKEVSEFHQNITKNRSDFLEEEIKKIKKEIIEREKTIKKLSEKRASSMEILRTHKALDEYTKLQERLSKESSKLEKVTSKISLLKQFEEKKSLVKIKKENLKVTTRRDLDDRQDFLSKAVNFFNENSKYLYNQPGRLIVDIGDSGFKFDVDIERTGSHGIGLMKIFCYDMTLAEIWSQKSIGPRFLIHDSIIFADVDERQVAKAIERAAHFSEKMNYQYICCLNSGYVPWSSFSESFDLREKIRVELKDDPPEQSLFGFRF